MRMRMMLPMAGVLALLSGVPAFANPVVVTCRPGEHAIVRDGFVRGHAVTRVGCVANRGYRVVTYRTGYGRRYRATRPHRSWGKSALIIGGLAGTGAGIGGIVHGKKGAALGAALGGGVASLYEGAHRR